MSKKELDFSLYASMMLPRPDRSPALSTRSLPTPPQGKDTLANRIGGRSITTSDSPSLASLSTNGGVADSDSDSDDDESAGCSMAIQINRVPIAADCYERGGHSSASSITSSGLQHLSSEISSSSDTSKIPEGSLPLTSTFKEVSSGLDGLSLTASQLSPSHIETANCNNINNDGSLDVPETDSPAYKEGDERRHEGEHGINED